MRIILVALFAGLAVIAAADLSAHHSFSAQYDGSKGIEIKGIVTKIEWANPHVYFYVDVEDTAGAVGNWACETAGPAGLIRQGWKRDALKVGDKVTVSGYPSRNGSKLMDARRVILADGRRIFGGSPGDGGPAR